MARVGRHTLAFKALKTLPKDGVQSVPTLRGESIKFQEEMHEDASYCGRFRPVRRQCEAEATRFLIITLSAAHTLCFAM